VRLAGAGFSEILPFDSQMQSNESNQSIGWMVISRLDLSLFQSTIKGSSHVPDQYRSPAVQDRSVP
jgi:hypothetical protein